jgi:Calcineurin-like phosphoesterase
MSDHRFSILVVDDGLDDIDPDTNLTRRQSYEQLRVAFDVQFAASLAHFDQLIIEQKFDAFLIDFVLHRWGTTATLVLARLGAKYPVGLISSFWRENFEELRQALDQHREVKALFCWDDLQQPERRGLIVFWLTRAIREYRGLSSITIGASDTIRLLHFSDLQFGGIEPKDFSSETHAMAESIRSHWRGNAPTFVAMTGDIAEHGLPSQYVSAQGWTERFLAAIAPGWTKDRLLLIPGNHDICRHLVAASGVVMPNVSAIDVTNSDMSKYAFAPFRQFAASLTGNENWHDPDTSHWVLGTFRYAGVIFFGYNTSEMLDEHGSTKRTVRDNRLAEMFAEVRRLKSDAPDGCISIALIHHPLVPLIPRDALAEPTAFYRNMAISRDMTWVFLTGHVHEGSASPQDQADVRFLEIISPTPTKEEAARPNDTLRGFNLIDLERENGVPVRLRVTSCEFSGFTVSPRPSLVFERPGGVGHFRRSGG